MVKCLKNLPISAKVLTDTRIGRGVNSIVKDGIFKSEPINQIALDLVNSWKALVQKKKNKSEESSAKNIIDTLPVEPVPVNENSQNSNLTEEDDQALEFISEAIKQKNLLQKRDKPENTYLSGLDELEEPPIKIPKDQEIVIQEPEPSP